VRVNRVKWVGGVGRSEWRRERECMSVWENKGEKEGGRREDIGRREANEIVRKA